MEEKRERMGLSEAPAELTWDATPPTPPPILQPEPAPEPEPEPPPSGPLIRQHGTEAMARFYKKRLSPSGHTPRVARPGLRVEPIAPPEPAPLEQLTEAELCGDLDRDERARAEACYRTDGEGVARPEEMEILKTGSAMLNGARRLLVLVRFPTDRPALHDRPALYV